MAIRYHFKIIGMIVIFLIGSLMLESLSSVLADDETANPYAGVRLSRLSLISGEVLLQRGDDGEWVPSSINIPLQPHDKLWATDGARAEIQFDDGSVVRLAENTNVDLLNLERGNAHLQLTLGVATFVTHFSSRGIGDEPLFEVDTPQAAILADSSSKFRIDVTEDGSTEITVREGQIKLSTDEEPVVVTRNQRIVIDSNETPRYLLEPVRPMDDWDFWNEERDRKMAQVSSQQYIPPDITMGVTELDVYGSWTQVPTYGWVWAPQVPVGWVPYHIGRWVWIEPWGWTWVSYEPWGWVPYHYGRWIVVSGEWVWVPGPRREVWGPGYVRFIHGPEWVAWIPLAPGEVYYYQPRISTRVDINLINYHAPRAVTIVPRETFITGAPFMGRFIPPADPIRTGRVIAGPPPLIPTQASLRPKPQEEVRTQLLPPPTIHRPVIYDHPIPNPPPRFENRIQELRETVLQGRPPIVAKPPIEEKRIPLVERPRGSEKIHKDFMVRKEIKTPIPSPPPREREFRPPAIQPRPDGFKKEGQPNLPKHFELQREGPGKRVEAKPLYRKPPQPARPRELK